MNEYYYREDRSAVRPQVNQTPTIQPKTGLDPSVDPRSPALDFERTPIVIQDDKQIDPSVEDANQLFEPMNKLSLFADPRSPTDGILRTPMDWVAEGSLPVDNTLSSLPFSLQLSFSSNVSDNSSDCLNATETKCLASTPLIDSNANKNENSGRQRVRTPLACVQRQTPRLASHRNQRQLAITKRAHLNSRKKKSKAMADSTDTSLNGNRFDGKENLE